MKPLFPGESGVDQLVEIIKVVLINVLFYIFTNKCCFASYYFCMMCQVLGTPTREEIKCMNPHYTEFKFPHIKTHPWHKVNNLGSYFTFFVFFSSFFLFYLPRFW